MKKRIGIALILAVVMVVSLCVPVLAWDREDSEVANSEDFIWGQGWDGGYPDGTLESYYGEQSWSYYETPSDGFNLYQDDVSDTGNLDLIAGVYTLTPGAIDLPNAIDFTAYEDNLWYMSSDESLDTWYWATEPRGYNIPEPKHEKHYITIILPDAKLRVERYGTMRYADVDFNDGTWRIQIWSGVRIWDDDSGAAHKLVVDENGNIVPDVWFMRGEPIVTRM